MCSNKLIEKTVFSEILQYFWGIFIKKQYKILQKSNTWHLWKVQVHFFFACPSQATGCLRCLNVFAPIWLSLAQWKFYLPNEWKRQFCIVMYEKMLTSQKCRCTFCLLALFRLLVFQGVLTYLPQSDFHLPNEWKRAFCIVVSVKMLSH